MKRNRFSIGFFTLIAFAIYCICFTEFCRLLCMYFSEFVDLFSIYWKYYDIGQTLFSYNHSSTSCMHKISNQTHPILPFYFGCLKVKQAFLFFQIGHGIDVILYSLMEDSFEFLTRFWCTVCPIFIRIRTTRNAKSFLHIKYTEKNGNERMQYL